jgi:hypothetical protein
MYIYNKCVCVLRCVSWSFIEPIHEVSRLRIGRSQFLKLPSVERRTCTMSFSDHETQRDASVIAVVCHFLFVSSVYIHKKNFFVRTSFINWTKAHVRAAIYSFFAFHFDRIYKKKEEERKKKDSKIFDLYTDRREGKRKCSLLLSSLLLPIRPLEKIVTTVQCWMNRRSEWRSVITGEWSN